MMSTEITSDLKEQARTLGFHAVGVARAKALTDAEQALRERLQSGLLKGYGFSPERIGRLAHPEQVLPGAKSVVVVALSYLNRTEAGPLFAARFAWGEDYHEVVSRRLKALAGWLQEHAHGARTVIGVDTGPFLERALAREAGVGAFGKNGLIRIPRYGSWIVLGEMLTDAELEPDEPLDCDLCRDCEVCIKACPTNSIVAPYILDANRCISHLTQMKGCIPRELRPLTDGMVYGCDVCQQCCPLNSGVQETDLPEFGLAVWPRTLVELVNIGEEEFNGTVGRTSAGWAKRVTIRRNAAMALGNLRDPSAIPALSVALADPEPIIRAHAAWAIGRIGEPEARRALSDALAREPTDDVAAEINAAIEQIHAS